MAVRTPALLLLSLTLLLVLLPTLTSAQFKPYPSPSNCGPRGKGGVPGPCPKGTCVNERMDCENADNKRKACKEKGCDELRALTEEARAQCNNAAACVAQACSESKCRNGGTRCVVQSYYKGDCCCP